MYMHAVYYVHECMYLIISYIQRCYVQDTILVIPPYPYCIEEENDDVPLEDCWYARLQLLFSNEYNFLPNHTIFLPSLPNYTIFLPNREISPTRTVQVLSRHYNHGTFARCAGMARRPLTM